MTASHDHHRRLFDLEVALTTLSRALVEAGHFGVVEEAARRARVDGARGAEELLLGDRVSAAYRRR